MEEDRPLSKREIRAQGRERRRKRRIERRRRQEMMTDAQKWVNPDKLIFTDRNKEPTHMSDLWRNCAGFLVCSGPSLRELDVSLLGHRGIVSLGVNNAAAYAPVRAMTFSDPPSKFHHGVLLDPALMKFVPTPKLGKTIRIKQGDTFHKTAIRVKDCPNVWGYHRSCKFTPELFMSSDHASWGNNNNGVKATGRDKLLFTFFLGLRLMRALGCRRVYLVGVDFNMDPTRGVLNNYAFGERRDDGACRSNNNSYHTARKWCDELKPLFDAEGFEVYNCNPNSALTCFDHVPYEMAIADCRGAVPVEPFDLYGWYSKEDKVERESDDAG